MSVITGCLCETGTGFFDSLQISRSYSRG